MSIPSGTIRWSSAILALPLALSSCGSSVDDNQTKAILQLDRRVSNLEAAAESENVVNNSDTPPPTSAEDFTNLANNLAEERDANSKAFLADQRLKNIEDRLDYVEEKQRELEIREMAKPSR